MPSVEPTPPKIELWPIERLIPYAKNSRTHTPAQIAQIAGSLREFGWTNPVLHDGAGGIIAGHGRVLAALQVWDAGFGIPNLPKGKVPVISLEHLTPAQRQAYIIADNRLAEMAGWDNEMLALELTALADADFDLNLIGFGDDDLAALMGNAASEAAPGAEDGTGPGSLAQRFGLPPFSVLSARDGWWQDRKRAWLALGIKSELGRGAADGSGEAVHG